MWRPWLQNRNCYNFPNTYICEGHRFVLAIGGLLRTVHHTKVVQLQYNIIYKIQSDTKFWLYFNFPTWCTDYYLFIQYYSPLHVSSINCSSSGGHSYIHAAYGTVTLYKSSWWPVDTQLEWELTLAAYQQATRNSYREWQYHMLHVYNYVLRMMSTWCSKHVEENSILWINNNQCIKLVINVQSIHDARSEKH